MNHSCSNNCPSLVIQNEQITGIHRSLVCTTLNIPLEFHFVKNMFITKEVAQGSLQYLKAWYLSWNSHLRSRDVNEETASKRRYINCIPIPIIYLYWQAFQREFKTELYVQGAYLCACKNQESNHCRCRV